MTRKVLPLAQKIAISNYLQTVLVIGEDGSVRYQDGVADVDVAKLHGCQTHHVQSVRQSIYGNLTKSPREPVDARVAKLEARVAKLERMLEGGNANG